MKRLFRQSLKDSIKGLRFAFETEKNIRIHTIMFIMVLILGLVMGANTLELALIILTSGQVIVAELINTAIENLVDVKVYGAYHPLARVAKDVAAAGVLFAAIISIVLGVIIFASIVLRNGWILEIL